MSEKDEIAFKDFKSSVSIGEFEAVLTVAKNEYDNMKEVLSAREDFIKEIQEKMSGDEAPDLVPDDVEAEEGAQEALIEKIIGGFERRTRKELVERFPDELHRLYDLTEFINRFQPRDEQYKQLDLTFLNV